MRVRVHDVADESPVVRDFLDEDAPNCIRSGSALSTLEGRVEESEEGLEEAEDVDVSAVVAEKEQAVGVRMQRVIPGER